MFSHSYAVWLLFYSMRPVLSFLKGHLRGFNHKTLLQSHTGCVMHNSKECQYYRSSRHVPKVYNMATPTGHLGEDAFSYKDIQPFNNTGKNIWKSWFRFFFFFQVNEKGELGYTVIVNKIIQAGERCSSGTIKARVDGEIIMKQETTKFMTHKTQGERQRQANGA